MDTLANYNVVEKPPVNARNMMEATTPSGRIAVLYDQTPHEFLRIALALKATSILITDLH